MEAASQSAGLARAHGSVPKEVEGVEAVGAVGAEEVWVAAVGVLARSRSANRTVGSTCCVDQLLI